MFKMIVLDLDGTTLDDMSLIPKENVNAIRTLQQKGLKVVIATGRPYSNCVHYYNELGLNTPLIVDNGATITNPSDTTFKPILKGVSHHYIKQLYDHTKKYTESAFFIHLDKTYSFNHNPRLLEIFLIKNSNDVTHCHLDDLTLDPCGLIYMIKSEHQQDFETYMEETFKDTLKIRSWGSDKHHAIYEIYNHDVSKASAILDVAHMLDVKQNEIIVFGDGINDYEMISAFHGVAMKNAVPNLKLVAKEVTEKSNHEAGLAHHLNLLFK